MDCPPKKVALLERWPLVENSTVFRNRCLGERSSKEKPDWWHTFQLVLCTLQFYRKSLQSVTIPARRQKKIILLLNRPFPHSCKQRHQLEGREDKIQWLVWNCPPEPRNCPPTPPLTQHFAPSETQMLTSSEGRGRWAVSLKPKLIRPHFFVFAHWSGIRERSIVISSYHLPRTRLLLVATI